MKTPVENGGVFELKLTGMAHGGYALGRHGGRVIFVPYGVPGELVKVSIYEDKGRFAYATVEEVIEASPDRVEPLCGHFGICGGCQWQHIAYRAQPGFKRHVLADQMERIGRFEGATDLIGEPVPSPSPWEYRVHATFALTSNGRLGFWSADHSHVVPLDECPILRPELVEMLGQLELDFEPIGKVRLQVGSGGDVMVILMLERDELPEMEIDLPVSVNVLLHDNVPLNLVGATTTTYDVRGRRFRVTAGGFFQVNIPVAEAVISEMLGLLDLQGTESVLDLYSGVGLFTAFLAEGASLVTSIESYPPAVTDAEVNLSEFDNVDIYEGAVEDVLPDLDERYDIAVIDPPRGGVSKKAMAALLTLRPARIAYISCDPATFARDAAQLARAGYRPLSIRPFDMFPQTFHIETVSLWSLV